MANITIAKPARGERVVVDNFVGKNLELSFPADTAEVSRSGQDLLILFPDAASVALPNFYAVYTAANLPDFVVNGAHTSGQQFFTDLTPDSHPDPASTGGHFTLLATTDLMAGTDPLPQAEPLNPFAPDPFAAPADRAPVADEPAASFTTPSVHPIAVKDIAVTHPNDSLLAFGSDDALFGGNDDDILCYPDSHTPDSDPGVDRVYGGAGNDLLFYDPDDTLINGGLGIDFLIQKSAEDLPSLDALLTDTVKNVEVLVRVGDDVDISNMNDLAHLGLTVENDTLVFSEQWTRDGNVFTNADHSAIVEVNAAADDIQTNVVRFAMEHNN